MREGYSVPGEMVPDSTNLAQMTLKDGGISVTPSTPYIKAPTMRFQNSACGFRKAELRRREPERLPFFAA